MPTLGDTYRGFYIKTNLYRAKNIPGVYTKRAICVCTKCGEEKDRIVNIQMVCGNCKYKERIFDRGEYYDIALSNGGFTKIDKEDLDKAKNYLWYKTIRNSVEARIGYKLVKLHRLIMGASDNSHIDHINLDTTDNRKSNLRKCTQAENNRNMGKKKNATSKYKYVYKHSSLWIARFIMNNKKYYKSFHNELEAAMWADKMIESFGDKFKSTNKSLGLL